MLAKHVRAPWRNVRGRIGLSDSIVHCGIDLLPVVEPGRRDGILGATSNAAPTVLEHFDVLFVLS